MPIARNKPYKFAKHIPQQYPYFITIITEKDEMNCRVIAKDFSIINVIRMLECLLEHELSFSDYFLLSGFGLKQSFLNYLDLCVKFKMVEKEKSPNLTFYHLKDKGKVFLEMFRHANL